MKLIKTILMVRHGSTAYNENSRLQGLVDEPLSRTGIREAELVAERLKNEPIDTIFHSPLSRAEQTADAINRHHGVIMKPVTAFLEMDMGKWEGMDFFKLIEEHPEVHYQWVTHPDGGVPGGESFRNLFQRVLPGVEEVIAAPFPNVLVVAHAMVNRAILGHMLKMDPVSARKFRTGNCSLSRLLIYKIKSSTHIVVDTWNNTDHLDTPNGLGK